MNVFQKLQFSKAGTFFTVSHSGCCSLSCATVTRQKHSTKLTRICYKSSILLLLFAKYLNIFGRGRCSLICSNLRYWYARVSLPLTNLNVGEEVVTKRTDGGSAVGFIFLNFSKSFNLVNRQFLFARLWWHGTASSLIKSVESFLRHRTLRVNANGTQSQMIVALSSVALCTIYINDLSDNLAANSLLCTDDIKCITLCNPWNYLDLIRCQYKFRYLSYTETITWASVGREFHEMDLECPIQSNSATISSNNLYSSRGL